MLKYYLDDSLYIISCFELCLMINDKVMPLSRANLWPLPYLIILSNTALNQLTTKH